MASSSAELAALSVLNREIVECRMCPRLVAYREEVSRVRRRSYRDQVYWGRPVPGFGDPNARLLLVGLAPGAHGANRTGRVFTGDRSGEFLYRALWQNGFASQPESISKDDGLQLHDAYITASIRCAPPDNKPQREEMIRCRPYLAAELALLTRVRIVVALGNLALQSYLTALQDAGRVKSRAAFPFAHSALFTTHPGGPLLLASYHPSQQNTSTRRLTSEMLRGIFAEARRLLENPDSTLPDRADSPK